MRKDGWTRIVVGVWGGVALLAGLRAQEQASSPGPAFAEVYNLVRSNLTGVSEAELNRAAVNGFLSQLQAQVTVVTNAEGTNAASAVPLVSKANVLDGAYAFLRIGRVGPGLAQQLKESCQPLRATNKLKGVIVDLRFAIGNDYPAAAEAADLFFKSEQPLLKWDDFTARSTAKTNALDLPVVVLVNHYTSGAAEALAAALRQADGAVLIGSPTAGRAYQYREFPLDDHRVLRIAHGAVLNGNGQPIPLSGLTPDIRITLSLEEEKAYFEDPYRAPPRPFAQSGKPGTNDLASTQNPNRPRRRLNEAELVRMQREGMDLESEPRSFGPAQGPGAGAGPLITDPALSRALDLLKGLALALKRH